MKRKPVKITYARAVEIAMNHNGIDRKTAEKYTLSELKEILYHLKIKATIIK